MTIITDDHEHIECKFIDFLESNVEITLWDDTVKTEEITNIAYIKS